MSQGQNSKNALGRSSQNYSKIFSFVKTEEQPQIVEKPECAEFYDELKLLNLKI